MAGTSRLRRTPNGHALAAAAAVLFAVSCGSSSQTVTSPTTDKCGLQVQAERTQFPPDGGSGTLRVVTNRECAWSVSSDAGWLTVPAAAGGQGEGSLTFTVSGNGDPSVRSGGITINSQQLRITQEGSPCQFRLSSDREQIGPAGGERQIEITSSSAQCAWTASTDASWIAIGAGQQGSGTGVVALRVDPAEAAGRVGFVKIAGQDVRVEQTGLQGPPPGQPPSPSPAPGPPSAGCSFSIPATTITVAAAGTSGEIPIATTAACTWGTLSQASWISVISGASGSGSGVVGYRVSPTDGPPRTGQLLIADKVVTVQQASGCAFSLDQTSHSLPAAGGGGAVLVTTAAGCTWTISTATPWITVIAGAGATGPGRLEFTVPANTGPQRSGSLTVAGRTVTVAQASGCTYGVAPGRIELPGTGATRAVDITTAAGCPWTVSAGASWITPSPASGTGPAQVQVTAGLNAAPPRSSSVSVAGENVAVFQESLCRYSLVPGASVYDPNGGSGAILVLVSGPCTWTATSTADWIRVTAGSSGAGDGVLQFVVAPNAGSGRSGTILIGPETHTVTQTGR